MKHLPFTQRAERRAEAEQSWSRFAVACSYFRSSRFLLRGLDLLIWAGAGLDVEVLQDVIVDLRGDLLVIQHLLYGFICGVGTDWCTPLHRSSTLSGFKTKPSK